MIQINMHTALIQLLESISPDNTNQRCRTAGLRQQKQSFWQESVVTSMPKYEVKFYI